MDAGVVLSVIVTIDDEEYTDHTDVVKNVAGSITLTDENGLQDDGTALPTDKLVVSYGAWLGTPKYITWYRSGAVVKIASLEALGIQQADMVLDGSVTALKAGEYYVVIENTAGDIFTSNSIEVTEDERAVMTDFAILDSYDTANLPELAAKTDDLVVEVTLNKQYTGQFYLIEAKKTTYKTADMVAAQLNLTSANGGYATANAKKKDSQVTAKAAMTGTPLDYIYYTAEDGTTHIMFQIAATTLTRGTDYQLIFDQDEIDSDNIDANASDATTSATTDNPNITEAFTCPYVEAPESIELSGYTAAGTTAKVTFYNEDGDALSWWDAANKTGFEAIDIYGVDSNAISVSDVPATVASYAVKEGVVTVNYTATAKTFAYAKATTTKGVFGKDSVTLTSDFAEQLSPAYTKMELGVGSASTTAKVSFTGLKKAASGTVYILQGDADTTGSENDTFAEIKAKDLETAVGSATVEGGSASVEIADVFAGDQLTTAGKGDYKNLFVAVFVPDLDDVYTKGYDGNGAGGVYTLKQKATSVKADLSHFRVVDDGTDTLTIGGLKAYDQFGNLMSEPSANNTAAVTAADSNSTQNESATAQYDIMATGALVVTIKDTTAAKGGAAHELDKGDGYSVSVLGSTVKVTADGADYVVGNTAGVVTTGLKVTVDGNQVATVNETQTPTGLSTNAVSHAQTAADNAVIGTVTIVDQNGLIVTDAATTVIEDATGVTIATIDGTATAGTITFAQNGAVAPAVGTYTATITASDATTVLGTVTITIT